MSEKTASVGTVESPLVSEEQTNGHKSNFNVIKVSLTFEGFEPWKFEFSRQSSAEVKKIRQDYFDLKEEDRLAGTSEYRARSLASLLLKKPENVFEFPDTGDFKTDFFEYFTREENTDYIDWLWNEHQAKIYPKEFTSRLFE